MRGQEDLYRKCAAIGIDVNRNTKVFHSIFNFFITSSLCVIGSFVDHFTNGKYVCEVRSQQCNGKCTLHKYSDFLDIYRYYLFSVQVCEWPALLLLYCELMGDDMESMT